MNPQDLAEILLEHHKVDLLMRPGSDLSKMLSISYLPDSGQLYFTCYHQSDCMTKVLPDVRQKLNAGKINEIFSVLLDNYFILDPFELPVGGAKSKPKSKPKAKSKSKSKSKEKSGGLTKTQLKRLSECLPLAVKGMPIDTISWCIEAPKLSDLKEMLELGANANYEFQPEGYDKDKKKTFKKPKRSILQFAIENKKMQVARLLIEHGAKVKYIFTDKKGGKRTLLHRAIDLGNVSAVELLLKHGADPNSQVYPNQMTPLHTALLPPMKPNATTVKAKLSIVKLLLAQNPNIFLKNKIVLKDKKITIESSILQSAKFFAKKLGGKFQSSKAVKMIEDYIGTISIAERLKGQIPDK